MVLPWAIFLLGLRPAFTRNRLLEYNVLKCYLAGFAPSLLETAYWCTMDRRTQLLPLIRSFIGKKQPFAFVSTIPPFNERAAHHKPKSVIRISLCRTAKRNPLIFSIWTRMIVVFLVIWPNIGYACLLFSPSRLALIAIRTELSSEISSCWN